MIEQIISSLSGRQQRRAALGTIDLGASQTFELDELPGHGEYRERKRIVGTQDRGADIDAVVKPDLVVTNAKAEGLRFIRSHERQVDCRERERRAIPFTRLLPKARDIDVRTNAPEWIREPAVDGEMFAALPRLQIDESTHRHIMTQYILVIDHIEKPQPN